ncbi:MAG: Asp-tRNA(Asn)/Glu-tRNA(Gln) amidotransferase subunit GatA [Alphaproteobacteria bacterium]|nr:Asp-tRNA(Asn)/Glu-tRNA(Gln) amidotransferase subunit GatA [Alphaproteobacteria bacterium]MDP6515724.1 Asp-tRNA(Asn)/Glu-tRNA(Gln) amidotransferase subunit GatA [Alphaproteobacteria bacterium]
MRDGLAARAFSAVELAQAHIEAAEEARPLNGYITESFRLALDRAVLADSRRMAGAAGPMSGIPIAVKDLFCTQGVETTAGSHILDRFTPTYESTVTANLARAGAVMIGKANMDEFAMGSSNTTSHHGPVENPWRREGDNRPLVPGGSSGGSAALVAARAVPAATGTDTGGSIRQPASFCGVVGMKPTYGRCSRWGMVAFASSLDQAGPLTRTVGDAAIVLAAMAGHDPKDSTSVDRPVPDYEAAMTGDIRGLKVGIPAEYRVSGMAEEIEALWRHGIDWLQAAGAETIDISLPHTKYALPTYYIIAPAEASSNLARYDGVKYGLRVADDDLIGQYRKTRSAGFGAEVKRRVMIGTYVLSAGYYDAYYLRAQRVRALIARDFENAFQSVDVILTPTTPSDAFPVGEKTDDPVAMYLNDVFTVPASLAGLPGISVPAGLSAGGAPLGLQLIAPTFAEEVMFRVAGVLEEAAAFSAEPGFMVGRAA